MSTSVVNAEEQHEDPPALTDRERTILRLVVEEFVDEAGPVGSRWSIPTASVPGVTWQWRLDGDASRSTLHTGVSATDTHLRTERSARGVIARVGSKN